MVPSAISVEKLSKSYRIGTRAPGADTLVELLGGLMRRPFSSARAPRQASEETFWALRDVSLDVRPGEVVGIIGRNGAGKSTLLKVLSRITAPTDGRVVIRGRVASLLEVGTGFHPELTGRENVFMNGSILGMRKTEITQKMDAIIDFAGIERFLDTPLKRYSTGMQVRLAFAVAAHLDPQVLVVDEVLAVGDAAFQRKCLDRLDNLARGSRTVLFVSHNMGAVTKLCSRAVWIAEGRVVADGPASEVVASYVSDNSSGAATYQAPHDEAKEAQLVAVTLRDQRGQEAGAFPFGDPISIDIRYRFKTPMRGYRIGFTLHLDDGSVLLGSSTMDTTYEGWESGAGLHEARVVIPANILNVGTYVLSFFLGQPNVRLHHTLDYVLSFNVEQGATPLGEAWPGPISIPLQWRGPNAV